MKSLLLVPLLLTPLSMLAAQKPYTLSHRIPLTGGEGWDCLAIEPTSQRLFVTRGNHVDVVDLKSEKVVGQISASISGAHDVAFVPKLKKGYITSGKSAQVVVFDLATLKILNLVPTGKNPDILTYDETTSKIFVFNGKDPSITVIDPSTDKVLKTIALDGKPEFAVANEGVVYFNAEDKNSIVAVDAKTMTIKKSWPLTGCVSPSGLSADFKSQRLFSACENEVMAISDSLSGKIIKTVPIGKGPDGAEFDDGLIFSSNGSGTLSVIKENDANNFEVLENPPTQNGARTMTVDHSNHNLYLIAAKYEPVPPSAPNSRPKIIPGSVEILVMKN